MRSVKSASNDCKIITYGLLPTLRRYLARLCAITLLAGSLQVAAQSPNGSPGLSAGTALRLHFDAGGLDIDARNAALSDVLSQLGDRANIRIRYNKRRLGLAAISLSLEDARLDKAIALILRGHSYSLNLDDQSSTLVVLSTGRGTSNSPASTSRIGVREGVVKASKATSPTKDPSKPDRSAAASSVPALEALIDDAENSLYDEQADEVSEVETSMAIEQLASIDHPDAAELIVWATSNDSNVADRALAADALWQHASNNSFADSEVNNALEKLADDADASVRSIAEQALKDMQAYRETQQ